MTTSSSVMAWVGMAIFLPLFPLSMVYTLLMKTLPLGWRVVLTLGWPQVGLAAAAIALPTPTPLSQGLLGWALATALIYAWRLLATRELAYWSAFYAVSAWALAWVGLGAGADLADMQIALACFSCVTALLMLASDALARRRGDAYLGLRGGLARHLPRMGGLMLIALLGVVAVPGFPTFFALLYWLALPGVTWAGIVGVLAVWLVWSWAAVEAWRVLAYGDEGTVQTARLRVPHDLAVGRLALVIAGVVASGGLAGFWTLSGWMK